MRDPRSLDTVTPEAFSSEERGCEWVQVSQSTPKASARGCPGSC
jgi:hypothetical protein